MKKELDTTKFHRQLGLVDPQKLYDLHVRIIGCGSIGSIIAITLAKMGVGTIELWDPDKVETPNLPNQFFRQQDLGVAKSQALSRTLTEDFGAFDAPFFVKAYDPADVAANASLPKADIVICAVDSMKFRKELWEKGIKNKFNPKLYMEARMGGEEFRLYSLQPLESSTHSAYEENLYSAEEASSLPCTEKSILYNVMFIASMVGSFVKKYAVGDPDIPFEVMGDFLNTQFHFNKAKSSLQPVGDTAEQARAEAVQDASI